MTQKEGSPIVIKETDRVTSPLQLLPIQPITGWLGDKTLSTNGSNRSLPRRRKESSASPLLKKIQQIIVQREAEGRLVQLVGQYDSPGIPVGYMKKYISHLGATIIYNPHDSNERKYAEKLAKPIWYGKTAERITKRLTDPSLSEAEQIPLRLHRIAASLEAYENQRKKENEIPQTSPTVQLDWSQVPIGIQQARNRRHLASQKDTPLPYPNAGFGPREVVGNTPFPSSIASQARKKS